MTCAWIETSSADTGSSATISRGSTASARAIADPLALAAGELVRIATRVLGREARPARAVRRPGAPRRLGPGQTVQHQRLAQHGAHRHARVERGVGVLEDHLHALASARASRCRRAPADPRPRSGPGRPRARAGAAPGGRPSTCRSPIRRPAPASRPARDGSRPRRRRAHGRRPAERAAPHREMLDQVLGAQQRSSERAHVATTRVTRRTCRRAAPARRPAGVRWPGATSTSGGAASRQAGSTKGQRAAKRQPSGGRVMSGTRPSIDGRRSRLSSSRGIEPSRPTV